MPINIIRFILVLRVCGLGELATLKLFVWLSQKFSKDSRTNRRIFLTNRVRSDGGGSQVLYSFFTLAVSQRMGIPYAHRPFREIEHHGGNQQGSVVSWNRAFDFSSRFPIPERMRVFSLGSRLHVLWALAENSAPIALTSHRIRAISDLNPSMLEEARQVLRAVYDAPIRPEETRGAPSKILFHLRRGDVSLEAHPSRFTSVEEILDDAKRVKFHFCDASAEISICTEPVPGGQNTYDPAMFQVFADNDPLDSLHRLSRARVLVTGTSSFSYLAGLLNPGSVVFRDFWHPPMSDWVLLRDLRTIEGTKRPSSE